VKRTLRNWIMAVVFAMTAGGGVVATIPSTVMAQDDSCGGILTLPPWYRGLTDADCNIVSPSELSGGLSAFIWTIALNIIEMIMQIVGYTTVVFLIYGGFKYMTAQGEAGKIVEAKDTIRNALIGLLIAIFSVAVVNFVAGAIT
jgi:hypothetical protein